MEVQIPEGFHFCSSECIADPMIVLYIYFSCSSIACFPQHMYPFPLVPMVSKLFPSCPCPPLVISGSGVFVTIIVQEQVIFHFDFTCIPMKTSGIEHFSYKQETHWPFVGPRLINV